MIRRLLITAQSLVELRDWIQGLDHEADAELMDLVDWSDLPTFGGESPGDTAGIWSWDEHMLLVGEGPQNDWTIVGREEWAEWVEYAKRDRGEMYAMSNARYKIVRMYEDVGRPNLVIKRGLTYDEAQAWIRDPETSSSTCQKWPGYRRTLKVGPWFDGFTGDDR